MRRMFKLSNALVFVGVLMVALGVSNAFADLLKNNGSLSSDQTDVPEALPTISIPQPSPTTPDLLSQNKDTFLSSVLPTPTPPADDIRAIYIPDRIVIPNISLDAPIVGAPHTTVKLNGMTLEQWEAPDKFAAGWFSTSAPLGLPGNTVIDGHHNIYGEVFGHLVDLAEGDLIQVYSGDKIFDYRVTNKMILKELGEPLSVRLANAQWIEPSQDERLTLITCWPHYTNTHRLIIVARPDGVETVPTVTPQIPPTVENK
jgi:LPXTG-site transpeptidase (sortase) family protein